MVEGRRVASTLSAMVVPGSAQVKAQAEAEGLDEVFRAAGFDWRSAGCSMCLGMNPDILSPGRALRLDLEPQLRGPPGQGRAHAPGLARRWPPRRRSRAASSTSGSGAERWSRWTIIEGDGLGARPRRRRHRPDHPEAVPEAGRAHRLRRVPLLRLDPRRRDRARAEPDPGRRAQLRLRLVARARALGAPGLRLRGDHRALVRRHLLRQLHQDRAAAGDPRRGRTAGRSPRPARRGSTSTTRRSTPPAAWSGSRSTRRSSTGSSTASTTSAITLQNAAAIDAFEAAGAPTAAR